MSYEKGVNGTYVDPATSNFKMAAMIGEGVSVISGNNWQRHRRSPTATDHGYPGQRTRAGSVSGGGQRRRQRPGRWQRRRGRSRIRRPGSRRQLATDRPARPAVAATVSVSLPADVK